MKVQVTSIEFDLEDAFGDLSESDFTDEELENGEKYVENLTQSVLNQVYEVDDEDEIADVISDSTGWCVKSLNYNVLT